MPTFFPPTTAPEELPAQLRQHGFAVLSRDSMLRWSGCDAAALDALSADWNQLEPDEYLRDGGRYRRRRHACYQVDETRSPETSDGAGAGSACVAEVAHRAHWQPLQYNALHGGMERWFAPIAAATSHSPVWLRLLASLADLASALRRPRAWFIEAHQFRIDTSDGIGRPTPEGAHRDGVDLVAVFLIARHAIKGGETRVFEANGPAGQRFTLTEPWSVLLLDDARMIHESTPIQPLAEFGWRDTLVVTCRAGGFQGADAAADKVGADAVAGIG
jgi:hypothetical protein